MLLPDGTNVNHESVNEPGAAVAKPRWTRRCRRRVLVGELDRLDPLTQTVLPDETRFAKDLRNRLGELPALFGRHILQDHQKEENVPGVFLACMPGLQ